MEAEWDAATVQDLQDHPARIEGQVRGIGRMIEERRRCDQIPMQVMAMRAALEKAAAAVAATSIDECLALPPDQSRKVIGNSVGMLALLWSATHGTFGAESDDQRHCIRWPGTVYA
jgi:DNA-binding FrmR family transcriptional regulator